MRRLSASARVLGGLTLVLTLCAGTAVAEPVSRQAPGALAAPKRDLKAPLSYLALGDSFSSGEGTFTWPGLFKKCTQYKEVAYADRALKLLAAKGGNGRASTLDFRACTGADAVGTDPEDLPAQLERVGDKKYDLITLTIGGNDAKFTRTLLDCYQLITVPSAEGLGRCKITNEKLNEQVDAIRSRLDTAYDQVAEHLKPGGKVIVLGYPLVLEDPSKWAAWSLRCMALHPDDVRRFRTHFGIRMNGLVKEVSQEHGFDFLDAQQTARFAGHNRCAGGDEWINGATYTRIQGTLHPNAKGYAKLAEALVTRIDKLFNSTPRRRHGVVDLVGRWERRSDLPTDVASLTVQKNGSARYFQEGDPYEYRGQVSKGSDGELSISLTGEDVYTGKPEPGKKVTMKPRLGAKGISFTTRSGGTTHKFWLGCHERAVGGWYRPLLPSRKGCEVNHMPAKAAYWPNDQAKDVDFGPSIRMEKRDHRALKSTNSREWQRQQREKLNKCQFAEAIRMDIDDINQRYPGKYKKAIKDMVNSMRHNSQLQEWLTKRNCKINYKVLP